MLNLNEYKYQIDFELMTKIQELANTLYENIKRKDNITPYIVHPEAVVKLLLDAGIYNTEILSAAYLHDVLEENHEFKYNPNKLKQYLKLFIEDEIFVTNVVDKVDYLTFYEDFYSNESKPYMKAFNMYELINVAKTYPDVLVIKLADRLANILDFYNGGDKFYAKKYFTRGEILFGAAYHFESNYSDQYLILLETENKTEEINTLIKHSFTYMWYFHNLLVKMKEIKTIISKKEK